MVADLFRYVIRAKENCKALVSICLLLDCACQSIGTSLAHRRRRTRHTDTRGPAPHRTRSRRPSGHRELNRHSLRHTLDAHSRTASPRLSAPLRASPRLHALEGTTSDSGGSLCTRSRRALGGREVSVRRSRPFRLPPAHIESVRAQALRGTTTRTHVALIGASSVIRSPR